MDMPLSQRTLSSKFPLFEDKIYFQMTLSSNHHLFEDEIYLQMTLSSNHHLFEGEHTTFVPELQAKHIHRHKAHPFRAQMPD